MTWTLLVKESTDDFRKSSRSREEFEFLTISTRTTGTKTKPISLLEVNQNLRLLNKEIRK